MTEIGNMYVFHQGPPTFPPVDNIDQVKIEEVFIKLLNMLVSPQGFLL